MASLRPLGSYVSINSTTEKTERTDAISARSDGRRQFGDACGLAHIAKLAAATSYPPLVLQDGVKAKTWTPFIAASRPSITKIGLRSENRSDEGRPPAKLY